MLPIDDLTRSIEILSGRLDEIAGSPALIVLNIVFGPALVTGTYFCSNLARNTGRIVWAVGLAMILAGAYFFYFSQHPPGEYYKEADIPEGQFAHMVLFMMFPLAPLFVVFSYIAGGVFPRSYIRGKPTSALQRAGVTEGGI